MCAFCDIILLLCDMLVIVCLYTLLRGDRNCPGGTFTPPSTGRELYSNGQVSPRTTAS